MNGNGNSTGGFAGRGALGRPLDHQGDDSSLTRSQTGFDTHGRSPDYDDDRLGDDKLLDGRHATDLNSDGTRRDMPPPAAAAPATDATSASVLGDNRDGLGRDQSDRVAADETGKLISSDKVVGTAVYNAAGEHLGSIYSVMLHKVSGRVAYAVMSFGGFLGIGHDHYPVPWSLLTYNTKLGGYEVNISDQQLKGAPSYASDNEWDWEDRKRAQQVYDYYRVPPYWL